MYLIQTRLLLLMRVVFLKITTFMRIVLIFNPGHTSLEIVTINIWGQGLKGQGLT